MNRKDYIDSHHLTPRCRTRVRQLGKVRIWRSKHVAWHSMFSTMTLDEIIGYLDVYPDIQHHAQWHVLFPKKKVGYLIYEVYTAQEAKRILIRLAQLIAHYQKRSL